jgi:hypothetical protein
MAHAALFVVLILLLVRPFSSLAQPRDSTRLTDPAASPSFAWTWKQPAVPSSRLVHAVVVRASAPEMNAEAAGVAAASEIRTRPEGRRALRFFAFPYYLLASDRYGKGDDPNDRCIATRLEEAVPRKRHVSIRVAPMPYSLPRGHELLFQTRSGLVYASLTENVAAGATRLPVRNAVGRGVLLEAASGTNVLVDFQCPWFDHAVRYMKQKMEAFWQAFHDAGGDVDIIVLDMETGLSNWGFRRAGGEEHIAAITNDPRWDDPEHGIDGISLKDRLAPHRLDDVMDLRVNDYLHWNALQRRLISEALNTVIFGPARAYFPSVKGVDYGSSGLTEEEARHAPDLNGHFQHEPHPFGTHGSAGFYGLIGQLRARDHKIGLVNAHGAHPYAVVRWQVKRARAMWRANDGQFLPWISRKGFPKSALHGTPYYEELVYHLALLGNPLLFWNSGTANRPRADDALVDRLLRDLDAQAGGSRPILESKGDIPWTADPLVTTMRYGSKRVYRITIQRVHPHDQRAITVRILENGVHTGESLLIRDGDVGAWHVQTESDAELSFRYEHPPVPNLLTESEHLTAPAWEKRGGALQREDAAPTGRGSAYRWEGRSSDAKLVHEPIRVDPGGHYTFSAWLRTRGEASIHIFSENLDGSLESTSFSSKGGGSDWKRIRLSFTVPEDVDKIRPGFAHEGADVLIHRPMLNQGRTEGPYTSSAKEEDT